MNHFEHVYMSQPTPFSSGLSTEQPTHDYFSDDALLDIRLLCPRNISNPESSFLSALTRLHDTLGEATSQAAALARAIEMIYPDSDLAFPLSTPTLPADLQWLCFDVNIPANYQWSYLPNQYDILTPLQVLLWVSQIQSTILRVEDARATLIERYSGAIMLTTEMKRLAWNLRCEVVEEWKEFVAVVESHVWRYLDWLETTVETDMEDEEWECVQVLIVRLRHRQVVGMAMIGDGVEDGR